MWAVFRALGALMLAAALGAPAAAVTALETPSLEADVAAGKLPPVAERLPTEPLLVDPTDTGRSHGQHGGVWRMLIGKARDVRYATVYGYARLVGVDVDYSLRADILKSFEVSPDGAVFTLRLRKGHKWSDGAPFTSEDFRYFWEDVANHPQLSPSGPPSELLVDGKPPVVTFPDAETVVYAFAGPHPTFLRQLAAAREPFIYRPAHYLKRFHAAYTDPASLSAEMKAGKHRSWAALHNDRDSMYNGDNPDLPSLQPWVPTPSATDGHFVWTRNPFYHRVDTQGRQLPYIDALDMTVASAGLIPAKSAAGEVDLQARGLPFSEAAVLKEGEAHGGYRLYVWKSGAAADIALYPNLNHEDPGFRALLRDARFRRALSLAIKRDVINTTLYFELATPAALSMTSASPLYDEKRAQAYATYDPAEAGRLLDEIGLVERNAEGVRLLPDGRPVEIVVETAGERPEEEKALQLVTTTWAEVGVKLILKPQDRDILRNRAYAGATMMSAWFGWDNGVATPNDPPEEQTPMRQDTLVWPKWGQHHQTKGEAGEPIDLPEAQRLYDLAQEWARTIDPSRRSEIWGEILDLHADQVFAIGLVNAAPQLVIASTKLANVPEEAVWSWDPGANFGMYRPDEFYFRSE